MLSGGEPILIMKRGDRRVLPAESGSQDGGMPRNGRSGRRSGEHMPAGRRTAAIGKVLYQDASGRDNHPRYGDSWFRIGAGRGSAGALPVMLFAFLSGNSALPYRFSALDLRQYLFRYSSCGTFRQGRIVRTAGGRSAAGRAALRRSSSGSASRSLFSRRCCNRMVIVIHL